LSGITLRLHHHEHVATLHAALIGRHSVHTVLRATAAGIALRLSWGEIQHGLTHAANQLRLVAVHTRQGALVLDDSYNASPESTLAALNLLHEMQGRKIAVLGGMFELGQYEKQGHELVGLRAAEVAERLITFGPLAELIANAAVNAGMPSSRMSHFNELSEIVENLQLTLQEGDVVLVKGSHGLRMDRIVCRAGGDRMKETSLALALSGLGFLLSVIWGSPLIRILKTFKIGKMIRVEGPDSHLSKMGTPTMGGVMFIVPVALLTGLLNAASLLGLTFLGNPSFCLLA